MLIFNTFPVLLLYHSVTAGVCLDKKVVQSSHLSINHWNNAIYFCICVSGKNNRVSDISGDPKKAISDMQVFSIESSEVRWGNQSILTDWIAPVCILWHWVTIHTLQFYIPTLIPLKTLLGTIVKAICLQWQGWSWEPLTETHQSRSSVMCLFFLEGNFTDNRVCTAEQAASQEWEVLEHAGATSAPFAPK